MTRRVLTAHFALSTLPFALKKRCLKSGSVFAVLFAFFTVGFKNRRKNIPKVIIYTFRKCNLFNDHKMHPRCLCNLRKNGSAILCLLLSCISSENIVK